MVCGGARTEPDYFAGLLRARRNPAVNVKVIDEARDPDSVIRYASGYADRSPTGFDQIWCVLDVDEFSFRAAVPAARRSGIRLAVSNPCFEVWLLLHHADVSGELANAQAAITKLVRHVPGYCKTRLRFEDFAAGVEAAVTRGRVLYAEGEGIGPNPSTGVWRLVEAIAIQPQLPAPSEPSSGV